MEKLQKITNTILNKENIFTQRNVKTRQETNAVKTLESDALLKDSENPVNADLAGKENNRKITDIE